MIYLESIKGQATSKGFHKEITIQDFPIRGKQVYLHIKPRRWQDNSTESIVTKNWDLVAKDTGMTNEFATFLKQIQLLRKTRINTKNKT